MLGVKRPNDICYIIRSYEELLEDDTISEDAKLQIQKLLNPNIEKSDFKENENNSNNEEKKNDNEYI